MKTAILAIPCLNEEEILKDTVEKTLDFLSKNVIDWDVRIIIVDNDSDDRTEEIGRLLAGKYPEKVSYRRLNRRGKGLAIRTAWTENHGDIYAFMDADLSTDLKSLPSLLSECPKGGMVVGSRSLPESETEKSRVRKMFSWGCHLMLKVLLKTKLSDLPCGFKAASPEVIREVLPEVQNDAWFFDTELTIRTEWHGRPIKEIPVRWSEVDDKTRPTRVSLTKVTKEYLIRSWTLRKELRKRILPRN